MIVKVPQHAARIRVVVFVVGSTTFDDALAGLTKTPDGSMNVNLGETTVQNCRGGLFPLVRLTPSLPLILVTPPSLLFPKKIVKGF